MTGPFGHSFQYVLEDNPFEERFEHANLAGGVSSRFHQATRANLHFSGRPFMVHDLLGGSADEVFDAIEGRGRFGPIISGTLDLDNLDNVVRLAFHMGLCDDEDRAVPLQLAPMLEPFEGRIAVPSRAEPLLVRWYDIRRRLYEYLLLDRGEFAAKAMLTLAVELAADAGMLRVDDWLRTDDELLKYLEEGGIGDHQKIGRYVKRLKIGDLFECVGVWRSSKTTVYQQFSEASNKRALEAVIDAELAQASGTRSSVCLHYILDVKKTCRSLHFRNLDTGGEMTIGRDSSTLLVGAFLTNARAIPLTEQERLRIAQRVKVALERTDLGVLEEAEEPLGVESNDFGLFAA
jgi:HD superfamily phosphohydrolase